MRIWRNLRVRGTDLAALDRRWSAKMAQVAESHALLRWGSVALAHAGDALLWLAIGLVILVWGSPRAREVLMQIGISVCLTALLVAGLKFGIRRERPRGKESAKWSLLPNHDLYSFPSGHAARAACIATSIAVAYPDVSLPFVIWLAGVCLSRVALAAHYLLDVLVGVLLGTSVAVLVTKAWPHIVVFLGRLPL
jgi:membrane-associated phospholipid phosphatase